MIRSMTGFARRERQGPWGTLTCELRSVNHRYLELSLRLPEDLASVAFEARSTQASTCVARRPRSPHWNSMLRWPNNCSRALPR